MKLQYYTQNLPAFAIPGHHMLSILTVFKPGASGKDYAAYRGIVPAESWREDNPPDGAGDVLKQGNKISEAEAEMMFDTGDLVWRR